MSRCASAVSAAAVLIAAAVASAQNPQTGGQTPSQEARKLLTRLEGAFNRGDAQGLADCWVAGGDLVGPSGQRVEGRPNIERAFRDFFAPRRDGKLKLHVASLRVAGDDLVLLDAVSRLKPETAESAGEDSLLSLVLVKRDGRWLIESGRETVTGASRRAGT